MPTLEEARQAWLRAVIETAEANPMCEKEILQFWIYGNDSDREDPFNYRLNAGGALMRLAAEALRARADAERLRADAKLLAEAFSVVHLSDDESWDLHKRAHSLVMRYKENPGGDTR